MQNWLFVGVLSFEQVRYMGKKLTVSKKSLMYALMILPFVFPEMFYFNGVLSKIIVAWKMLVVVFSGLLLIKQRLHIKKSRLFLFLFLLYNIALSFYNGVMPSFEIYELSMVIIFCYYLAIRLQRYSFFFT